MFLNIFVFPGGSSNTKSASYCKGLMTTLVTEVQNRGYQYYDWNADSTDAARNNQAVSVLVKNGTSSKAKNINLLMHDTAANQQQWKLYQRLLNIIKN